MSERRIKKVNSLLKEVLSDIIFKAVKHPKIIDESISITRVDISKDLQHAKVFVTIISFKSTPKETVSALQASSKFIMAKASKQIRLRYFPILIFQIDDSIEKHERIESLLWNIRQDLIECPDENVSM